MNEPTETNSPEKASEHFCIDNENLLFYGKEGSAAIRGYIPMTQEIFDRCFRLATACWDSETIRYLFKTFPEFV